MVSLRWIKLLGPGTRPFWEQKHPGPTNTYGTRVQPPNHADDLLPGADIGGAVSFCHVGFIVSHTSDPASVTNLREIFRPDKLYPLSFLPAPGPLATWLRAYRRFFVRGRRATFDGYGYTSRRVGLNEKRLQIFCKARKIRNFSCTAWTVFVMSIRLFPIIVRSLGIK